MKVAIIVSIDLDDLIKVMEKILIGESSNLSEFIQKAVKKELESDKTESDKTHITETNNKTKKKHEINHKIWHY